VGGADATHIYRAGAQRSRIRVDTEDFREGSAAFLARRTPDFKGR
jgi:enoyl-CoA hydratase/carnithine racemase